MKSSHRDAPNLHKVTNHIEPSSEEAIEANDLRSALIFGGVLIVCLSGLILASSNNIAALQIPPFELSMVTLAALLVTMGGLLGAQRSGWVRATSWVVLTCYTVLIALTVHYTGGPTTPVPVLYVLVVVGASFLLGRRGAMGLAVLSLVSYALILYLEYAGILPMIQIWRLSFDPRERGSLLIINWITLAFPVLIVSQLAGTLAERLKETNLQLRKSERVRQSLSDMVVHDLRNPLTALLGTLEVLDTMLGETMSSSQRSLLKNAQRSGSSMVELVSQLLDISKMEAAEFTLALELVDLCKLLEETVATMRGLVERQGLTVHVDTCALAESVICDRQLIGRVVGNLISNAIKYTPSGGEIALRAQKEDAHVMVSVVDTGQGIPPEYLDTIFDKFSQVENPSNVRRGTGLGLTFCKMMIEAHGGRIWVESKVGEGTTFSFTLPLRSGASGAS